MPSAKKKSLEKLTANNEVAGFKFALIGVLYAVLLGFTVIIVWEQFEDVEKDVVTKAATWSPRSRF